MWKVEIRHDGLNAYRCIRGRDIDEVEVKAELQRRAWEARWADVQARRNERQQRQRWLDTRRRNKEVARESTLEAQEAIAALSRILRDGLSRDPRLDWALLEVHEEFAVNPPANPDLRRVSPRPEQSAYAPTLTFLQRLVPPLRRQAHNDADASWHRAIAEWEAHRTAIERENAKLRADFDSDNRTWAGQKEAYDRAQELHNQKVRALRQEYEAAGSHAIVEYCEAVLAASPYPEYFPRATEIAYNADVRRLVVEYDLPSPHQMPKTKEVKFVATKNAFSETVHSDTFLRRLYDETIYQIALRTVHELFAADTVNAIDSVAFNGWVHATDRATGHDTYAPILSLHVTREEFGALDLSKVDPKTCFKKLKGVSSSGLADLAAVRPLVAIDRSDARFVAAEKVAVNDSTNLAAMDWEDFEHLIRELFERMFSADGGEVHITRASRDAGVDAVAFDPHPIRGGKIVIQAKRYTNTVELSAVRDLYGTVHNEGAMKGILVTTSDYGADAYEFAKGKPLTLVNGSHLLYLLQKNGYRAHIDIREARQQVRDQLRSATTPRP